MLKNNRRDNPKAQKKYGKSSSSNSFNKPNRPVGGANNRGARQDRDFPKETGRDFGRKDNYGSKEFKGFKRETGRGFDRKDSGGFKDGARGAKRTKRDFDSKFASKFEKNTTKTTKKPTNVRVAGSDKFIRNNNYKKKADTIDMFDRSDTSYKTDKIKTSVISDEESGMVYGRNAVLELLKSGKTVDKLFVQSGQREGSVTMIVAEAIKRSIPVIEADKRKLDSMLNHASHQGVVALASEKEYCSIDDILEIAEARGQAPFVLVADKIMDSHNLGAIIRSAECAGVHGIIIPKRNAVGISPIVVKASAGASVHMAVAKVANISTAIGELKEKGVWVFSAVAGDEAENCVSYSDADYTVPTALVVGNEGEGLSPIIIKNSDFLVTIPMFGKIESLNVSCASAILLYEAAKQRKAK